MNARSGKWMTPGTRCPLSGYIAFILLLSVVTGILSASGDTLPNRAGINLTSEERAWLDTHPEKLTLFFNTEFPPIEFISPSGAFTGMGADVIARVEELLGISFIKSPSDDWNAHLAALRRGECAVAPTIVRTTERESYAFFTLPYASVPVVLITTRATSEKLTIDDLAGLRVGVVSGYATEAYLRAHALYDQFELISVSSVSEGLQRTAFGQMDVFVENLAVAAWYIELEGIPNLRVAGTTEYAFAWSIGVSREYPLLYSAVHKALAQIPPAELDAIRKKWIALEVETGMDPQLRRMLLLIGLFTVLLLVSLGGITIILKQRLNRDIIRREAMLEALRQSEENYRSLFENAMEGVFQTTPDGKFLSANPFLATLLGFESPRELMQSITDMAQQHYANPGDREKFKTTLESQGAIQNFETQLLHKDGAMLWVSLNARAVRDAAGAIQYYEGTLVDISARKQAEEVLQRSEERARRQRAAIAELALDATLNAGAREAAFARLVEVTAATLQVAHASIWLFFEDGASLECVDKYEADTGRHLGGAQLHTADIPRYFEAIRAENRIYAEDAQNDPRTCELAATYLIPQGITSMLDAGIHFQGKLAGVICMEHIGKKRQWHSDEEAFASTMAGMAAQVLSNAEQRRLEAQLRHAQKMEAVGVLAGGIAHDFNNILQAISGYVQLMLLQKAENSANNAKLEHIQKACQRAQALVQQMLAFSRQMDSARRPLDLNHEIRGTLTLLAHSIPRMIRIEPELARELWPIDADPVQIQQIIMNLCSNAADAMPDGGRLKIATCNTTLKDWQAHDTFTIRAGRYVVLRVVDSGCGIHEDLQQKVFDPFFTTKAVGKGTGLGLASVYGIVKSLDGYILCQSAPGQGSTFTIYLPVLARGPSVALPPPQAPITGGTETILVVDDEEAIRDFSREALTNFGYTVLSAASGDEALTIYDRQEHNIDLVLLDLNMPGMGGRQCLAELRQRDMTVKVLIASGYTADGPDLLAAGAQDFIAKPYQIAQLLGKVRQILNHQAERAVLAAGESL